VPATVSMHRNSFATMTRVFPLPGQETRHTCPSSSIASFCSGVSRIGSQPLQGVSQVFGHGGSGYRVFGKRLRIPGFAEAFRCPENPVLCGVQIRLSSRCGLLLQLPQGIRQTRSADFAGTRFQHRKRAVQGQLSLKCRPAKPPTPGATVRDLPPLLRPPRWGRHRRAAGRRP
jgi:hypothetical protein